MFVVIYQPSTGVTLVSRRVRDDESLDEMDYARDYAARIERSIAPRDGHIPSCAGDIRVEFREDAANDFHIWSGESFYLADDQY